MVARTTQICNMQALLLQFHHPTSFLPSLLHFNLTQSCPLAANTKRIVPQVGRLRSSRSGKRSRPTYTRVDNNTFGDSALFTSFCSLQGAAAMEQQQVLADTDDVSHLSHVSAQFLVLFSSQYFLLLLLRPLGLEFVICLDCFLDSAVLSLGYMKGWFLCVGHSLCVCFELVCAIFLGWVG
jgi:hypothetical protein